MRAERLFWVLGLMALAVAGCAARGPYDHRFRPGAVRRDLDAGFDEAVALAADGRYDPAAERFGRLAEMYEYEQQSEAVPDAAGQPDTRALGRGRAAEAVFWLGYCREKQGLADEAAKHYRRVIDEYGGAPAARQARLRLAHLEGRPGP